MRPTDHVKADSRSAQSFAIIKNRLDTGILLLAVFTLELEMDYPSETSLCRVAPFPTDTPSPIFSEGRGRLYTGYSIFKLRRITYLTRIIKRDVVIDYFCCSGIVMYWKTCSVNRD